VSELEGCDWTPDEPVSEAVPKVPPCDPILLIDIGRIAAQAVVRPCIRTRIVDNGQDLQMLCRFGDFIPLVRRSDGRIFFGLIGQVLRISTQPVPRKLRFILYKDAKLVQGRKSFVSHSPEVICALAR
jgi:hypothetical protein